jgi:hypothetical protein
MSAGSNPQPSVLFLQKLSEVDAGLLNARDYPIFMASINKIGYDLNTKTAPILYKKEDNGEIIKDALGKPIIDSEVAEVIEAFLDYRRRHRLEFAGQDERRMQ